MTHLFDNDLYQILYDKIFFKGYLQEITKQLHKFHSNKEKIILTCLWRLSRCRQKYLEKGP